MMNDFNNFIEQINNCFTRNEANIKSDVIEYKDGYEILSDIRSEEHTSELQSH